MDVLSSRYVKAKKQHTCDLCGGKIEPGTIYEYQFIAGDAGAWEFKTHSHCVNIAAEFEAYGDEGLSAESMWYELRERLKEMLTKDEYESMSLSTQDMIDLYLKKKGEEKR